MNVLSGLSGSIEILQKICVFAAGAGVEDPRKYRIVFLATLRNTNSGLTPSMLHSWFIEYISANHHWLLSGLILRFLSNKGPHIYIIFYFTLTSMDDVSFFREPMI